MRLSNLVTRISPRFWFNITSSICKLINSLILVSCFYLELYFSSSVFINSAFRMIMLTIDACSIDDQYA